ncbi:hypothetical protein [Ekhidna sp.]|uniref:hypothetical protein n=1 Tax=Ekhidna sp. TaxID=2608089 RepID=UPI003B597189
MERIEYQITFVSFFIGLGVADLFTSLVRMIKEKHKVQWHWLPLFWIVIAFMGLIIGWFAFFAMFQNELTRYAWGFIFAIAPAIFIFAFTVSVVPHKIPMEGLNLKEYYFQHQKLIFTFLSLDYLFRILTWYFIINPMYANSDILSQLIVFLTIEVLVVGLIFIKNLKYHAFVATVVFLFLLLQLVFQQV